MNTYYRPIKLIKPNTAEVKGLPIKVYGIKLMVNCLNPDCKNRWNLYFKDLDALENELPIDWWVCGQCNKVEDD